jgi:hypothetical protein
MWRFIALVAGTLARGWAVDGAAVAVASPAGPVRRPIGRGGKGVPGRIHTRGDRRRAEVPSRRWILLTCGGAPVRAVPLRLRAHQRHVSTRTQLRNAVGRSRSECDS